MKNIRRKDNYKARLARGFQQKSIFEDVYSPVLRFQTFRIVLSIVGHRIYYIHQMDVKGFFFLVKPMKTFI